MSIDLSPRFVFCGVPSYFAASCRTAARGRLLGYSLAGHGLMAGVRELEPYECDSEEWEALCDELDELVVARENEAVWKWFVDHFPKCMKLVPRRRSDSFLAGVYRAAEEMV